MIRSRYQVLDPPRACAKCGRGPYQRKGSLWNHVGVDHAELGDRERSDVVHRSMGV